MPREVKNIKYMKKKAMGRPIKYRSEFHPQEKIPKTFSLRRHVVDQLNRAKYRKGINLSHVLDILLVDYLKDIGSWEPPIIEETIIDERLIQPKNETPLSEKDLKLLPTLKKINNTIRK